MIKISPAQIDDVWGIVEILQQNLIDINSQKNVNANDLSNQGFLIRDIKPKEIRRLIATSKNNIVLIAQDDNQIIGYLIASRLSAMADNFQNMILSHIKKAKIDWQSKVIFYRQIAVRQGFVGVGGALLLELIKQAKKSGYRYMVCRIIHQPINNQKSISFHRKFGFELIDIDTTEENIVAGIYLLDLVKF